MRYHVYEDHDDIHLQIDSSHNIVIIEGRDELERLLKKLKEGLKKDDGRIKHAVQNQKERR